MFQFQQFTINQDRCAMKVGTDGVLLGAWAPGGQRILDIGTGTGLVALMMAQRFPTAQVTAVELDPDAARQAADNAAASPFAPRITVLQADINSLAPRPTPLAPKNNSLSSFLFPLSSKNTSPLAPKFDSLVCNPPYYANTLPSRNQQRDMARSAQTLTFAQLMTVAARLLTPQGKLTVVAPADAASELETQASLCGLYIYVRARVKTVSRKPPKRVLLTFSPTRPQQLVDQTVVLQADDGSRSPWYAALTSDFYIH